MAIREEKERKGTQTGKEVKQSLFEDDAILDIETLKLLGSPLEESHRGISASTQVGLDGPEGNPLAGLCDFTMILGLLAQCNH